MAPRITQLANPLLPSIRSLRERVGELAPFKATGAGIQAKHDLWTSGTLNEAQEWREEAQEVLVSFLWLLLLYGLLTARVCFF
jgi:hypothetical protein